MSTRIRHAAAVLTLFAVALAPTASGQGVQFTDPAGDNPSGLAADVTYVAVAHDDERISFSVGIANRVALERADAAYIYLNTDGDAKSGQNGFEYRIQAFGGTNAVGLARWTGTAWDENVPQSSFSGSFGRVFTASVARRDLGNPSTLVLFVLTLWDGGNVDHAPDDATTGGRFTVALGSSAAPKDPAVVADPAVATAQPEQPRAADVPATAAVQPAVDADGELVSAEDRSPADQELGDPFGAGAQASHTAPAAPTCAPDASSAQCRVDAGLRPPATVALPAPEVDAPRPGPPTLKQEPNETEATSRKSEARKKAKAKAKAKSRAKAKSKAKTRRSP